MTTLNIPSRTLPLGQAVIEGPVNIDITSLAATLDFSGWTLAALLDFEILFSFDNAGSWESAQKASGITPPPWRVFGGLFTSQMTCNVKYPVVRHPTNVRVITTVTGNPIPLGNSTVVLT